jgi:predicted metal-dependent enzyme (double-stranded beta helix superfamily)
MTVTFEPTSQLDTLVTGVRRTITAGNDDWLTTRLVADQLRQHLPRPDILTPAQREGDPHQYRSHLLHVEPDGSFSVLALVWRRPHQLVRVRRRPRHRT